MTKSINDLRRSWLLEKYPINTSLTDLIYKHATTAPVGSNYLENRLGVTFAELRALYPSKSINDALYAFYQTPSTTITPEITAHRLTGVAPLAITFDSLSTTSTQTAFPFCFVNHKWNFGDTAGGATWSQGTQPGVNSKNLASGPVVTHVFETPGTYTVTLTCQDDLNTSSRTATVTVTDPNTVFAGTSTICISQNSLPVVGVNGVPAGAAVQQVPNWTTVQTLAQTYKRILLKRGDVWTDSGQVTLGAAHAGPGIIGAYGTGAAPIISSSASVTQLQFMAGAADWRVMDIVSTGVSSTPRNWSVGIETGNTSNILLLRMEVKLHDVQGLLFNNSDGVYVVDSIIGPSSANGGDRTYAAYGHNLSRCGFVGTRFFGATSHTMRIQGADRTFVSNSTFNAPGASSYARITIRGKVNDADPAIWNGLWSEYNVISDNNVDAGDSTYTPINCGPQNDQSAERLRFMLCERNFVDAQTANGIQFQIANSLVVRNNLIRTTNGNFIAIEATNTAGSPYPSSGWIHSNSAAQYTPQSPWGAGIAIHSNATGQVINNNLMHAPGSNMDAIQGTGWSGVGNTTTTQLRSVTSPYAGGSPVTVANFRPVGYPVGSAVANVLFEDYTGAVRTIPQSVGALNP